MRVTIHASAVVLGLFLCSTDVCHGSLTASFQGLGFFPGLNNSSASAISGDGTTVVGNSSGQAFYWRASTGLVPLGTLSGASIYSDPASVSFDGSVIVGVSSSVAFRWTSATGIVGLGDLSGGPVSSNAQGVSDDGQITVGAGTVTSVGTPSNWNRTVRWNGSGSPQNIQSQIGGTYGSAYSVSGDGSVIVGYTSVPGGINAYRHTVGGGTVLLGDFSGGSTSSIAFSASADGSVVVGAGFHSVEREPFRWTADSGLVGLGRLGDAGSSSYGVANDVSADGSIIVGDSNGQAFVWDQVHGIRSLSSILSSNGIDLSEWSRLVSARGISADGTKIVGFGHHNGNVEGFIAVIPEPATLGCLAPICLAIIVRRRQRRQSSE